MTLTPPVWTPPSQYGPPLLKYGITYREIFHMCKNLRSVIDAVEQYSVVSMTMGGVRIRGVVDTAVSSSSILLYSAADGQI